MMHPAITAAEIFGRDAGPAGRKASQATQLVDLALASGMELWHSLAGDAYATLIVDGHREHHPLRRVVRDYLAHTYYVHHRRGASSAALTDALATLSGMARYDGRLYPVGVRVVHHTDRIYIDLGDPDWHSIAITGDGWRVVDTAPVRCWRPASLRELPMPTSGGSIDEMRELWPVDDSTWTLVVSWLVATLSCGPYPVLVEIGEQGSGKSTLGRMLRGLIDPASPELRGIPRDERDVMIGARASYIIALDNLSGLAVWLSDALCRVATGGGLATRTLYSDLDETLVDVMRPILLTGIDSPATRGDLLDRALVVTLPPMPDHLRRDEAELWRRYHAMRPALLGAVCDAAVMALRGVSTVQLARRPRMADACCWVAAAEPALGWPAGQTLAAWIGARDAASADLLAMDPVAQALMAVMGERENWSGTAAELLTLLCGRVPESTRGRRDWPGSARGLAGILRRLAPDLRRMGITIEEPRRTGHTRQRVLTIVRIVRTDPDPPDPPDSVGSFGADGRADDLADDPGQSSATVRTPTADMRDFRPDLVQADDADDADGRLRTRHTTQEGVPDERY